MILSVPLKRLCVHITPALEKWKLIKTVLHTGAWEILYEKDGRTPFLEFLFENPYSDKSPTCERYSKVTIYSTKYKNIYLTIRCLEKLVNIYTKKKVKHPHVF